MSNKKVIVRFAPSPTGSFHLGSVRTALYNYLFAKKEEGKMLLRIEDTDKERSKKEFEEEIYDSLEWLGLDYEKEILKSSERTNIYKEKLQELIKNGSAYLAESQNSLDGHHQGKVVRFKNPGGKITFTDLIRGKIVEDVTDLKDFIIAKNLEEPLYHLAVVVDDMESEITHVIRGEDHISNTTRQILIARALGKKEDFKYVHLPLVLAEDKSKLSKRKHGENASLKYYIKKGYEPEAILNFLALIGWNPGTNQEIFSLKELIKEFDTAKIQKKGAIFNVEKLDWLNREYILRLSDEDKFSIFNLEFSKSKWKDSEKIKDEVFMKKLLEIMLERIHRWGEVEELLERGEFDYMFERPKIDGDKICWKKQNKEGVERIMNHELRIMEENTDIKKIKEKIMEYAEKEGKGETLWPLRYALSGRDKSPDPFTLLDILGKEESKERIEKAIKLLSS